MVWRIKENYQISAGKAFLMLLVSLIFTAIFIALIIIVLWMYISAKIQSGVSQLNFNLNNSALNLPAQIILSLI